MAGKGRRIWGRETLGATDLQDYVQDQVVMNYASASARAAAIPTATEGMVSYLADVDALEVCTVTGSPGQWQRVTPGDTGWQNLTITSPLAVGSDGARYRVRAGLCSLKLHVVYTGPWANGFVVTTLPANARPLYKDWFDGLFYAPDQRIEVDVFPNGQVTVGRAVTTNSGGGFVLSASFPVG
jgi:hypothetical protein